MGIVPKDYDEFVMVVTRIDNTERRKLLRYAAKLPDSSLRKAMGSALAFFYQNRSNYPGISKAVIIHCGYLMALKHYHYAQHKSMKRKNSSDYADVIDDLKLDKFKTKAKQKKPALIKNKINVHILEIKDARDAGMSYHDIKLHLYDCYKINVSKEYVRRIVNAAS